MSLSSNSVASEQPDPDAPLRLVEIGSLTFSIRQRVTGALYVRWPNGAEQVWPVGFSLDAVEQALREQFATPNEGGAR